MRSVSCWATRLSGFTVPLLPESFRELWTVGGRRAILAADPTRLRSKPLLAIIWNRMYMQYWAQVHGQERFLMKTDVVLIAFAPELYGQPRPIN